MAEVGNLYYTFLPYKPSNGAVSDYTKTGTMTIDEMKWTVPGNWYANGELRLGGKSITNVDRVITAQDAMGSAISKIRIAHTGVTSDKITLNSVTVTTASDADFTQNVTTKTVSDFTVAKNTTDTIDVVPATEPWAINSYYKIAFNITNSAGSNYSLLVKSILFYAYAEGVDPQPTTQDLYLKLSSDWAGWPAKYAVYYFNDTENGWSEFMTEVEGEENTYTATIPVGFSKVIFVRFNSEKTATGNWDDKWSQTVDLTIPEGKNHFTVTSGGTGSDCDGTWSKYPVIPTYYVKGTFDEWGDGHEMTEGTYTFENLAAGTYQIKVVDDANNWLGYDYLDATKSSAHVYSQGDEKNIKFTLAEAGNVTVAYDGAKIIVTGTFVAPTTKFTVTVPEGTENVYIAGNFNNWTFAQMTLKAGEEDVFELTVSEVESDTVAYKYLAGTDWKFEEVIENNRSYNAADEVSAWKAVPTIYKYAKVKEAPVNWTGHYILAWEDLKPRSVISGKDFVADANAAAFTDGDTISIMEGNDFAVEIRFSEAAGKYTVKLPNDKYLAIPSENAMSEKEDPFAFSMAYFKGENQEGVQFGNGDLTSTSTRMMYKNNNYFRSYTSKINNTSYKLPTLYRLVDEAFDCQDGPYALLVNGTTVIPAKMEAKEGYNEYAMYASLVKGDSVQVLNTSCGGLWIPTLEEAGAAEHFAKGLAAATVDSTGCYDFYFKQIPNDQKMYIGFGICADDTIRYTVRGKGGILGEDFEKAIDSKQDTLELALEAGKYELKVVVGADWKGFEQLTDTATGLKVGEMDNICFELNEAGTVQVVYNDTVFKLIGNFYVAPAPDPTVSVKGSMNDWAEEIPFVLSDDKTYASLTVENIGADNYDFKFIINGEWRSNGYTYHRDFPGAAGITENNDANMVFQADVDGEYTFYWYFANDSAAIVYPAPAMFYVTGDSALVKDAAGLEKKDEWKAKAIKAEQDTLVLSLKADQEYKLKLIEDGNWEGGKVYGYDALTQEDKAGLSADNDNNIVFKLNEDGDVKVVYFWEEDTENDEWKMTFKLIGDFYVEPEIPHTYTVVGPSLPNKWDETSTASEMKLVEGVYTYVLADVELKAGAHEYKIVEDHAWDVAFPQDGNASFSVEKDGIYDVTFTLNKETKAYTAVPELKQEIIIAPTAVLMGLAEVEPWTVGESMEVAEGFKTASITKHFVPSKAEGDTLKFKVVINDAWRSNAYLYHRGFVGAAGITMNIEGDDCDMKVVVDVEGDYTFTWTFENDSIGITFPEKPEPVMVDGYYIIGLNGWNVADLTEGDLLESTGIETNEFSINLTLHLNDEFKVVRIVDDMIQEWYPAEGDNYVVDDHHYGATTVYFRPNYNGNEDWFAGCIYVLPTSTVDIDILDTNAPAVKILRDGQILIIKGTKTFNIQGQLVR